MSHSPNGRPDILNDCLALAHVPRWTILPLLRHQSVAEHSFRVAIILMELALRLDLTIPYPVLVWALVHDGPECRTSDIPGPFKHPDQMAQDRHVCPWWAEFKLHVPDNWYLLVKVADLLETGTFIKRWSNGRHAEYCAEHILGPEMRQAVAMAAIAFDYGESVMSGAVSGVIADIEGEKGRFPLPTPGHTSNA